MEKQGYNNRIRVILADRQVTNRTLADMLGVSPMTVSRWVTNRYQPSMSQFVEISKMLNVDIRELIEVDPLEISGDVKTETSSRPEPLRSRINTISVMQFIKFSSVIKYDCPVFRPYSHIITDFLHLSTHLFDYFRFYSPTLRTLDKFF